MDGLLWVLVLADVCGNVSTALLALSISLLSIIAIVLCIGAIVVNDDESQRERIAAFRGRTKPFVIAAVVGCLLGAACPSKQTIYIVVGVKAVTQLSEKAVGSAIGQKTIRLIEKRLDDAFSDGTGQQKERDVIVVQSPAPAQVAPAPAKEEGDR